jgi:hypothetical protein
MHSLTTSFKTEVLLHTASFYINNNPDGPCLLKQILNITYIDNKGSITHIQQSLISMPNKLIEVGSDITKLNSWILGQVQKLAALGESATDLLILPHLWNAYLSAQYIKFVSYIEQVMNHHEVGTKVCTYPELMLLAENNYKLRVQKGQWGKQSATTDHSDLVAMFTQFQNSLKKKSGKNLTKSSIKASNTTSKREPWKFVSDGSKTKDKNGHTYHWCPYHDTSGMWTMHDPATCRNTKHVNHPLYKADKTTAEKEEQVAHMAATALSTIINEFGDNDEDSDDE